MSWIYGMIFILIQISTKSSRRNQHVVAATPLLQGKRDQQFFCCERNLCICTRRLMRYSCKVCLNHCRLSVCVYRSSSHCVMPDYVVFFALRLKANEGARRRLHISESSRETIRFIYLSPRVLSLWLWVIWILSRQRKNCNRGIKGETSTLLRILLCLLRKLLPTIL